jgi:hypothetical protein
VIFTFFVMTGEHISWDRHPHVYESVMTSSNELVLQPRCSRNRAMRSAWSSFILFEVLILPLMMIPIVGVVIIIFGGLNAIMPVFQDRTIARIYFCLPWSICLAAIGFLTWRAMWESGYKTFVFDRIKKQLVINIANLLGQNYVKIIPFEQIQDAQFQESTDEDVSMSAILFIPQAPRNLGLFSQQQLVLSSYTANEYKTVTTLTAKKDCQELLLLVRTALGFSTGKILADLKRSRQIPTQAELQQEKAQAMLDAKNSLKSLAKTLFSGQEARAEGLEIWREKTRQFPEDPQIWEDFAIRLALEKNVRKDEIIYAYRQAEALYLDREDTERALEIAQIIKKIG